MHVSQSCFTTKPMCNMPESSATRIPEFYTGSPIDAEDLWFRGEFLSELWDTLETKHCLLTAPRRTGKTSVMDHLQASPRAGYTVISVNVQDLSHPADFFQTVLDTFYDEHPSFFRDAIAAGWEMLQKAFAKIEEVEGAGFKVALRSSDPNWKENWRQHGKDFLDAIRKNQRRVLIVVDELPDMLLNMQKEDEDLMVQFLAWWRSQRLEPHPKQDIVRWLVGGSVNLKGTLDAINKVDLINDLEDVPLPSLTPGQVEHFVREMLGRRGVPIDDSLPVRMIQRLGQPIPLFMQMATQDLYRRWKRRSPTQKAVLLDHKDIDQVFDDLVRSSAARDKLQHYYSRIERYYVEPALSAAYAILGKLSLVEAGLSKGALQQEFDRVLHESRWQGPSHQQKKLFNQLLYDLENDFYVLEVQENRYDYANGLLKSWWRKYYA